MSYFVEKRGKDQRFWQKVFDGIGKQKPAIPSSYALTVKKLFKIVTILCNRYYWSICIFCASQLSLIGMIHFSSNSFFVVTRLLKYSESENRKLCSNAYSTC